MSKFYDQRVCLKFGYNNEISADNAIKMMNNAFENEAMGKTAVYKWYDNIKNGREMIDDELRGGHPTAHHRKDDF